MYEIHITGNVKILNICNMLGIKVLTIDSMKRDNTVLKTEYITSMIIKNLTHYRAIEFANNLASTLQMFGVDIYRIKVEVPFTEIARYPSVLYIESHWEVNNATGEFPVSFNINKKKWLATDRVLNLKELSRVLNFTEKHANHECEACIYDTNLKLDNDWMREYNQPTYGEVIN